MKKFLLKLVLFLLPLLSVCVLILFQPLERKYALNSLPVDCDGRGGWIWNRLYNDSTPVDVAFIGSSHTINGINDTFITSLLRSELKNSITVANLGYCRFGKDLNVVLARDIFATKKPKLVVIEVNESFTTGSHPVFPYYASTHDLLQPASMFSQNYPSNIYEGFLARLAQLRTSTFGIPVIDSSSNVSYGYLGNPTPANPALLIEPDTSRNHGSGMLWELSQKYPEAWIASLVELCKKNGAEICFIYLPAYHEQPEPLNGTRTLCAFGKVLTIPRSMIADKKLWRDADHFDDAGATLFSSWLAHQIICLQLIK